MRQFIGNGVARCFAAIVWAIIGIASSGTFFVWLDRASARRDTPEFSGWGILFVLGCLAVLAGIYLGWWLSTAQWHNWSTTCNVSCGAIAILVIVFARPEIGWAASGRLLIIVGVAALYLAIAGLIASNLGRE